MTVDARIVAVLLTLTLVSADGTTDDSQQEMEVIFPEDEFSNRFSDCVYLGDSPECIIYVSVGEFNITVVGVAENWSRDEKPKPCKYFTCDSNITSSDGELFCQEQDKSTVCNKRLEPQFSREPVKTRRGPTCAVLFLSEAFDTFGFDELSSFESCSSSCSCETPVATTHTPVSTIDTITVRFVSIDTENTTEASVTTVKSRSGHSIENVSANTTVATATTVVVVAATATTVSSTEQLVFQNTSTETSGSTNESSVHNQTVEDTGDNDTLVGNNTDDLTSSSGTGIIVGAVMAVVIVVIVAGGWYCHRRVTAHQSKEQSHSHHEMVQMDNQSLPTNSRRQSRTDTGQDPDTNEPLVFAGRDAQPEEV